MEIPELKFLECFGLGSFLDGWNFFSFCGDSLVPVFIGLECLSQGFFFSSSLLANSGGKPYHQEFTFAYHQVEPICGDVYHSKRAWNVSIFTVRWNQKFRFFPIFIFSYLTFAVMSFAAENGTTDSQIIDSYKLLDLCNENWMFDVPVNF